VARERLAQDADRARIELGGRAAVGGAQAMLEQPRLAERGDQLAAAHIDGRALRRMGIACQMAARPAFRFLCEKPMFLAEEWPLQSLGVAVHQSPSKTGFFFAANAS
jgi:hypothetical protein